MQSEPPVPRYLPDSHLALTWRHLRPTDTDFALRTTQYFGVLRDIAVQASWIGLVGSGSQQARAFDWIGQHIHQINQTLHDILKDCLTCFEADQLPPLQVLAAPILDRVGIDGFCNLQVRPVTLLIDPSRVVAADWPKLVVHELAHGLVCSAGHGAEFRDMLSFLCLAADLPCPPPDCLDTEVLRYWPPCRSNPHGEIFWLGGESAV